MNLKSIPKKETPSSLQSLHLSPSSVVQSSVLTLIATTNQPTKETMEEVRINKYLANAGVCSRREADSLIKAGKIRINGQIATLGSLVSANDQVQYGKKQIGTAERKVVLAYNKPKGVVCSNKDAHAEKLIHDMIKYPIRVTYAGRLDKDSTGLLLLTNDGDLIQSLMRSANHHEKEYIVKVKKAITEPFLDKMSKGIYLKELDATTRECKVEKIGTYTFRIILTQGLNRQIRRMCAMCNNEVVNLQRIRVANILLDQLKPNEFREVTGEELQKLYQQII